MTATEHARASSRRALGRARELMPGLCVTAAGTAAAAALSALLPPVSTLTAGVGLGVLVGRFLRGRTRAGLTWATTKCLRLGVVVLGLQLGLGEIVELGLGTVLAVVASVAIAFFGTLALARLVGVSSGLGLLVATGFSICGASAIAAMNAVSDTDERDVATAVALVTLYGSAAIALVPLVGDAAGMGPELLGTWAGLSVHEVGQVVAAASPAGATAVAAAVVVKLTRVVLLAPMVAGVSVLQPRRVTTTGRRPPIVPLFVVGFLVMMLVRSSGIIATGTLAAAQVLTTLLLGAALFGLGSAVRLGALLRTGRRALVLGALSTVLVGLVGFGAVTLTAAASG